MMAAKAAAQQQIVTLPLGLPSGQDASCRPPTCSASLPTCSASFSTTLSTCSHAADLAFRSRLASMWGPRGRRKDLCRDLHNELAYFNTALSISMPPIGRKNYGYGYGCCCFGFSSDCRPKNCWPSEDCSHSDRICHRALDSRLECLQKVGQGEGMKAKRKGRLFVRPSLNFAAILADISSSKDKGRCEGDDDDDALLVSRRSTLKGERRLPRRSLYHSSRLTDTSSSESVEDEGRCEDDDALLVSRRSTLTVALLSIVAGVHGVDGVGYERAWADEGLLKKGLSKYIKKKKLDPLETFVPSILLSRDQIESLDGLLTVDVPGFSDARSLLRTGVTASLRIDARAVASYAAEAGQGPVAEKAVTDCLSALEKLDYQLLAASRSQTAVPIAPLQKSVASAVSALDTLLGTVPTDILQKGEAVVTAYQQALTSANTEGQQQVPLQQENAATDLPSGSGGGTESDHKSGSES